jgi:hypothetical protein
VDGSELIGHATESFVQRTPQALRELRTGKCIIFEQKTDSTHRKQARVTEMKQTEWRRTDWLNIGKQIS